MAVRLPILEWLRSYERRWLRGDVAAGIAVTALIVPKDLGYAGIAGVPLQNGLYAAAAGAIIYALFCTSRQISTGPSSSLAAVAGGAVLATGACGRRRRGARRGDHAGLRAAVPRVRAAAAGVDRALPLQGRDHRLPGGRRRRRGDRRAAQAHRDRCGGQERVARARVVDRLARRRARVDGGRRGARAGADPRPALPGPRRPGRAGARRRGDPRLAACSTSKRTGSRSSATCRAGCRRPSCRASTSSATTSRRSPSPRSRCC